VTSNLEVRTGKGKGLTYASVGTPIALTVAASFGPSGAGSSA